MRLLRFGTLVVLTFVAFTTLSATRAANGAGTIMTLLGHTTAHARDLREDVSLGVSNTDNPAPQYSSQPISRELSSSAEHGIARGLATADAHAAVGDLGIKVFGSAHVPDRGNADATASVSVVASWQDTIRIVAPFVTVSAVDVYFNLKIGGDIAASALGVESSGLVDLRLTDLGTIHTLPSPPYFNSLWGRASARSLTGLDDVRPIPGLLPLFMSAPLNAEFNVGYEMHVDGTAFSDNRTQFRTGSGLFSCDVSGSLHWGGIESIRGPGGVVIPRDQWSVISASGFDYSKSFEEQIPEPSSMVLVSSALFLWWRRTPTRDARRR